MIHLPVDSWFVQIKQPRNYIRALCARQKPRKVIVCMYYYPDMKQTGSWADGTLGCLQYGSHPEKLQALIRSAFRLATSRIRVPGTEVRLLYKDINIS